MNSMRHARSFSTALLVFVLGASTALGQLTPWRRDYNAARKEATEKNRPLLIEFGTENCVWCKKLDASTLSDPTIASLLRSRFIPLKIDAEQNAQMTQALNIQSFPTLIIAANDGRIITIIEGYVEAPKLLEQLQKVLGPSAALDWMARDYQEASKALALGDNARAMALLKTIIKEDQNLPLQRNAKEALVVLEKQADNRRIHRAKELMVMAREDFRSQQFNGCLEKCDLLVALHADLPEAAEASQMAAEVRRNPEWLTKACADQNERLSNLYLSLAEAWIRKGKPEEAANCYEKIQLLFPGTQYARMAQVKLGQLQGRPTQRTEYKKAP